MQRLCPIEPILEGELMRGGVLPLYGAAHYLIRFAVELKRGGLSGGVGIERGQNPFYVPPGINFVHGLVGPDYAAGIIEYERGHIDCIYYGRSGGRIFKEYIVALLLKLPPARAYYYQAYAEARHNERRGQKADPERL